MIQVPIVMKFWSSGFSAVALSKKKPIIPGTAQMKMIPASFTIELTMSIRKKSIKLSKMSEMADLALSM